MEDLDALGAIEESEAKVRLTHAEALFAIGAREESHRALGVARGYVLSQAVKILDQRARESFLTRVPENARILASSSRDQNVPNSETPGLPRP